MAAGRPTLNTLIKALNSAQCDSVEKAIALLSPIDATDRVLAGWDQIKRGQILDKLLSFPPMDDKASITQLGQALVNSGVSSGKPNDGIMGLVALAAHALEKDHSQWLEVLLENVPGAVWTCVYTTQHVPAWMKRPTTSERARWRMGQHAAKNTRSRGAYQGTHQARKLIELLETLMDILPQDQFPLRGKDLPHIERLVNGAGDPAGKFGERLLRWARREALEQETRWVPGRDTVRAPRM